MLARSILSKKTKVVGSQTYLPTFATFIACRVTVSRGKPIAWLVPVLMCKLCARASVYSNSNIVSLSINIPCFQPRSI